MNDKQPTTKVNYIIYSLHTLKIRWSQKQTNKSHRNFWLQAQSFFTSNCHCHSRYMFLSSSVNLLLTIYVPRMIKPEGASSLGVVNSCSSVFGP